MPSITSKIVSDNYATKGLNSIDKNLQKATKLI